MNKTYTIQNVSQEAAKYQKKKEFWTNSPGHYAAAKRLGILSSICKHMEPRKASNKKWDLDNLKSIASKYESRDVFKNKEYSAYRAAVKLGILNDVCKHMPLLKKPNGYWNKKTLQKEALKYKTKSEFLKKNSAAYVTAKNMDLKDIYSHMDTLWEKKWTPELSQKEALKYSSRAEFQKKSNGAYMSAHKKGFLDKICSHMLKNGNTSNPEKEVFEIVKSMYTKTVKLRIRKKNLIPNRPHIQGFDIDIYVPELRKGIEFDGTYWHSLEGLKKGRSEWTDEQINSYHSDKDGYFNSCGIEILHIKETDWKNDKENCISKIFNFIGEDHGS